MVQSTKLPLADIKVIEFSHMVMGPSAGVVLADLGADVVKIEPLGGDKTRLLRGSGAGYFAMYNRNKQSICVDLKSSQGNELVRRLVSEADVVIENFRPGAMEKLGYGYDELASANPRLIYCSARGFLNGPYQHRTALDEVAQMMGGLAYMTGKPGQPMRAGASVIDVMGGMFAVIGILSALESRRETGRGQEITSALFESTVFLMGQHMAQQAVMQMPVQPMSVRTSAWGIYDLFNTGDGQQVFVAVVSDSQWRSFCQEFELEEFGVDPGLVANNDRVANRDQIIPAVQALFSSLSKSQLMVKLERCGLPFAGVSTPADLLEDPHLQSSGGLLDVSYANDELTQLPALPLQMDGHRFGVRRDVPRYGQHTIDVLNGAGYSTKEIQTLIDEGIVEANE